MTESHNPNLPSVQRELVKIASIIDSLEDMNASPGVSVENFERTSDVIEQLEESRAFLHAFADAMLDEPAATLDDLKPRFRDRGLRIVDRYLASRRG